MDTVSGYINSGIKITSDLSLINRDEWNDFVLSHPGGNIFQSPYMVDLYLQTGIYEPLCLFAADASGKISGLLVAGIIHNGTFLKRWVSSRAIITGGPLVNEHEGEIAGELIRALKRQVSGKVTYIQIRNLHDTSHYKGNILDNGFTFEDHLDILFDLTASQDDLWHAIHTTRRKQISRAERRGVQIDIPDCPDKETIDKCYRILENVYRRAGLPLPSEGFFFKSFESLSQLKMIKAFLARTEDKIIGFRFVLLYRDMVYDWYAGSDTRYNDRYPNDILPWAVIKWGKEQGFRIFDFGGAGHPKEKYGVRDYKLRFGGNVVNYGRYLAVNRPLIYLAARQYLRVKKQKAGSENSD